MFARIDSRKSASVYSSAFVLPRDGYKAAFEKCSQFLILTPSEKKIRHK